ncbi:hypothetical protein SAMN05421882_102146 [Nitrosomonas communis]|uniref:Uncharacterized protein n=1 Tax=Nitrosomonas communis TaxID=44574 RepID=A0A1H2VGR1_9PROT|nr:hypothetical protein SAMN05421882_102146 [Nitrosomonas communis]
MLAQPITVRQVNIFCEQRSIVTKREKQAIREADARKYEFLAAPNILSL